MRSITQIMNDPQPAARTLSLLSYLSDSCERHTCGSMKASMRTGKHRKPHLLLVVVASLTFARCNGNSSNSNGVGSAWILTPRSLLPRQHQRQPLCPQRLRMAASTTTTTATATPFSSAQSSRQFASSASKPASTAIVGGGPSGLATALMLARRGYRDITVLERLMEPPPPASAAWGNPERSYNLGIGGRGQRALRELGAADRVLSWCADSMGRKDWNPQSPDGAERVFSERTYTTKVIARDRLTSCLLEEVREKHSDAISVKFGVECTKAEWHEPTGGTGATLSLKSNIERSSVSSTPSRDSEAKFVGSKLTADFVVAADGVKSAIRDGLERDAELTKGLSGHALRVKKFPKLNEFVYKVIPFKLNNGWRNDFNYSHRTKGDINLEALPTKEGWQVGVLLFRPNDERVLGLNSASDARSLFMELFPQFADMISEEGYERLALQKVSRLPSFSYSGPVVHLGRSAVLLGDAIKSVKPYFGLGVNTAFEDITMLDRCLAETKDDLSKALPLYSRRRAPEAKAVVEMSRQFDRTGVVGFFTFIFPLILDVTCNKVAPRIFAPNTISCLQQEGVTFRQISRRKLLDRVMQGVLFSTLCAVTFVAVRAVGRRVVLPLAAAAVNALRQTRVA